MSTYIDECLRLFNKYNMGEDIESYKKALENKEFVDIPYIEMIVTTVCNLKCKYCSNLIPSLSTHEHFSLEKIKQEIDMLLENVHWVYRLKVHGGEPLCYPYLSEFLEYVINKRQIIDVRIATNGTIIPSKNVLEQMKSPKFFLNISNYEFAKKNALDLIEALNQNNIRYFYFDKQDWCDLGDYRENKCRTREETENITALCNMRKCTSYYRGKIYVCSWEANRSQILKDKSTGLSIDKRGLTNKIRDFFEQKYFPSCDYCNGILPDSKTIDAGEQKNAN